MEVIYETVYRVRHELMGHYAAESAAPRTDREYSHREKKEQAGLQLLGGQRVLTERILSMLMVPNRAPALEYWAGVYAGT